MFLFIINPVKNTKINIHIEHFNINYSYELLKHTKQELKVLQLPYELGAKNLRFLGIITETHNDKFCVLICKAISFLSVEDFFIIT